KLTPTDSFNLFNYMYFYNGSGLAAADLNNDGKTDLFFAANQGENKIYLNEGQLKFKDVTKASGIPQDGGWSTGVSVVDINNDGLPDLYICRVGNYLSLQSKNQLLVCQGITDGVPQYKDLAKQYGLDYSGFSTQAAFFDADMDGDPDMFLLNHSVHENGVYRPRQEFLGKTHPVNGARMYRNDGNYFTDITETSGINSSVIGYGLGICIADINLDGYPDLYIGNDFHENDYLYINNGKGLFTEEITKRVAHTSRFTMGVDIADINNDGHSEIISMDMLSDDPYTLKRSLGEDDYDIFNLKISYGYQHQYTRNNLQYNRRNGHFSETGLYAGVAATDWSWSPLWMDFDNDGLKDLFISNGIPKRMNDIDYINFISNEEMQRKLAPGSKGTNSLEMIDKFPKIKIRNKFFRNNGKLGFNDIKGEIGDAPETYSNGSVYADFDNDGDLDIVVNNIDEPATLYRNNSRESDSANSFLRLQLKGPKLNPSAIGAKLIVFAGGETRVYEKFGVHGFQSSSDGPMHIGLGGLKADSIKLVWPDNTWQPVSIALKDTVLNVVYTETLPEFDYLPVFHKPHYEGGIVSDITSATGLAFQHKENLFNEFNREQLIPHMLSTEGPALAAGDFNGDGLEDLFLGAARNQVSQIWVQGPNGKFYLSVQPALSADSAYEDVSAVWVDVNKDGRPDLIVGSGGNEFYGGSELQQPRLYLNDGKTLVRKTDAFPKMNTTVSVVTAADFNKDGANDLFVGGRAVPMEYGSLPQSYLLMNDGTGKFRDVTNINATGLSNAGFVTSAAWADMNKDGSPDLIVSYEWGPLRLFVNNNGSLAEKLITDRNGWWNFVIAVDVDNDGDQDLVAGNLGLNSRLNASAEEPVKMYHFDFDGNGRKEQVVTYFVNHKEIPFASIAELSKQMPVIRKKFLYAGDFAKASLDEIFDKSKLKAAASYSATYMSNAVFINDGNLNFELKALPWEAQLTSYRDAVVVDANKDPLPDLLLVGNYFDSNTEMGRYDADMGTILINKGNGEFKVETLNGAVVKGQSRHAVKLSNGMIVIGRNNDSTVVLKF
ncbi:MAG: hypothetical protein EOO02_06470, partial [Chitinophagaceae bacterium]